MTKYLNLTSKITVTKKLYLEIQKKKRNKDKSTPIEIQTNAIWLDNKGLNGIKGRAIVGGVKDNKKYNSTKRLYNVQDLTETILNNAETTIPAIFIPRKTKVQIVFPLNNKK